jgi:catechol 2,3-dioxygenase-like lactoylglutathione lyase family enzyme
MVSVRHIALFVSNLREAESFFQQVFDMELLMRETPLDDQLWYTLPMDKGWEDAEAAGVKINMVALKRDEFVLALFEGSPTPIGTVLEIGIMMGAEDIEAVRSRLTEKAQVVAHERDDLMFSDPYGYLWHIWLEGVPFQSNGKSVGRWLEV